MQRTKEKKNRTNRQEFPSINSVIDIKRNQIKHIPRGRRKKRENAANVNFLTTNSIAVISGLEMDYFFGQGLFEDGKTPIDLIKMLYPIMRDDISIFLHTAIFSEETKPIEFLNWMLNLYEEIHHEPFWEVGDNTTYKTFDYVHEENGRSVSMSWLPQMKSDNDKWYKFLTGALGLLDNLGIPFWWNDEDYDYAIDIAESGIIEHQEELKSVKGSYDTEEREKEVIKEIKGYIRDIRKDLKMHKVTAKEIQNDIENGEFNHSLYNEMIARTPLEKSCRNFIDHVLEFCHKYHDDNLMRYVHFIGTELEDGTPITPDKYCAVGWNYGDDDAVASNMSMITQSNWQEYGSTPFRFVEVGDEDAEVSMMPYHWMNILPELQKVADHYQ